LKKIDANGLVVSSLTCVVYVGLSILFLRSFAGSWGITREPSTAASGGIMKYYVAILLTIFGGILLVLIMYRLDSLMKTPAPEWVYALFGIAVPFAIYFGIPAFST
jgi:hypothetical protein